MSPKGRFASQASGLKLDLGQTAPKADAPEPRAGMPGCTPILSTMPAPATIGLPPSLLFYPRIHDGSP